MSRSQVTWVASAEPTTSAIDRQRTLASQAPTAPSWPLASRISTHLSETTTEGFRLSILRSVPSHSLSQYLLFFSYCSLPTPYCSPSLITPLPFWLHFPSQLLLSSLSLASIITLFCVSPLHSAHILFHSPSLPLSLHFPPLISPLSLSLTSLLLCSLPFPLASILLPSHYHSPFLPYNSTLFIASLLFSLPFQPRIAALPFPHHTSVLC